MAEGIISIEDLFEEFLTETVVSSSDLEYCLLQSTVEPTIRFKFGSWLYSKYGNNSTINLMEANRIDLVFGIDNIVFIIEFGHLLNLLQHGALLNENKIASDAEKIEAKALSLVNKIKKGATHIKNIPLEDLKFRYVLCSLFSDIKVKENNDKFEVVSKISTQNSGTLFKYGRSFKGSAAQNYFRHYLTYLSGSADNSKQNFLIGYKEFIVIPEVLSMHYKFTYVQNCIFA